MGYVLGVDQGATKTDAVIATVAGEIIGKARVEGSCHSVYGMAHAMCRVRKAAEAAIAGSEVDPKELRLGYYGLSGADWPDEYDLLRRNIEKLGLTPMNIVNNDCWLSFRAGSLAPFGIVVARGTAVNAAGRSPRGEVYTYGYFADEADVEWLIDAVLKAVFWAEDGRGEATILTEAVLGMAGVTGVVALKRGIVENRISKEVFREVPKLLFEVAYDGDIVALGLVRELALAVSRYVIALIRRFNMAKEEFDVVLGGSVLKGKGTLLNETIAAEVHSIAPKARIIQARYEPVVGAALLGLEELGISLNPEIMQKVEDSSRRLGLIRYER